MWHDCLSENIEEKTMQKVTVTFMARAYLAKDNSLAIIGSGEPLGDWNTHAPVYAHLTTPVSREWMVKVEIKQGLEFYWSWIIVNSRGNMLRRESKPRRRFVQLGYEDIIIHADYNGPMEVFRFVDKCLTSSTKNQQKRGYSVLGSDHTPSRQALIGAGDIGMNVQKMDVQVSYTQHTKRQLLSAEKRFQCLETPSIKEPIYGACIKTQHYPPPSFHDKAVVPYIWTPPIPVHCWIFQTIVTPKLCVSNKLTGEVTFPSSSRNLWNMAVIKRQNKIQENNSNSARIYGDGVNTLKKAYASIVRQAKERLLAWISSPFV